MESEENETPDSNNTPKKTEADLWKERVQDSKEATSPKKIIGLLGILAILVLLLVVFKPFQKESDPVNKEIISDGFVSKTLPEITSEMDPLKAYWLGAKEANGASLRETSVVKDLEKIKDQVGGDPQALAVTNYSSPNKSESTYIASYGIADVEFVSNFQGCLTNLKCARFTEKISTPIGDGILKPVDPSSKFPDNWEIQILTSDLQLVYIVNDADIDYKDVSSKLAVIDE